jgi:hypothetical protein
MTRHTFGIKQAAGQANITTDLPGKERMLEEPKKT